jgi:hypothetical protein
MNLKFELFPNLAKDYITLKMPGELQNPTVNIFNIQGKVMKSFSVDESQNQLDISYFSTGVYLVNIQSDKKHILKKFVKQ